MTNGNGGKGNGLLMATGPGSAPTGGYAQGPPPGSGEPDDGGLSLRDYLSVVWRRKWVIMLVIVVATASAYYFANRQPKQYSATATMIYETPSQVSDALVGGSYTNVYDRDVMMNSVNDLLQSPDLVKRMQAKLTEQGYVDVSTAVTAAPRGGTGGGSLSTESIVTVSAAGTDPRLAAATANAAAQTFVEWRSERVKVGIQQTIVAVRDRMATYSGNAKKSTDYLLLEQRLGDLKILASTASGGFRVLLPAAVPTVPYAPDPKRSALLGFLVGVVAALCLAFLLELFDTRIRKTEDIAQILRQPILGRIPRISSKLLGDSSLVTMKHPEGHIAEAFRMVRTNLEFMAVDMEVGSLLVTSCVKGEGKSVAVANLAISMALAGKKVVVIDADMRRPRQHKLFGLDNEQGLSTVATGRAKLVDALVRVDVAPMQDGAGAAKAVAGGADFSAWAQGADALSRLYVLPSGPIPPNPGEIVASRRLQTIISSLEAEADLVIVDTPAMLAVGDTSAIAARVDGVVFLVDLKRIKKPQLYTAAEQLYRLPTKSLGIVLRMHGGRGSHYYYSPYYYYRYSYTEDGAKSRTKKRRGSHSPGAANPVAPTPTAPTSPD